MARALRCLRIQTMSEFNYGKNPKRWVITVSAVTWCLGVWFVLFTQTTSYPIGSQDYGFPLTFKRVYEVDVVLFFSQAFLFDVALAALVVSAVAYSCWHWSSSWSTGFCAAFLLNLICSAGLYWIRDGIPSQLEMLYSYGLVVAVPIAWLICVVYSSGIASKHFFGTNRSFLFPLGLAVVVPGLAWQCRPQDIFCSDGNPRNFPALAELLSNDNPHVRSLSLFALKRHGPFDDSTTTAIIQAMSDPDPQVQSKAISMTLELGPSAIKALPILRDCFIKNESCTDVLAALGPLAKELVPDLKAKLPASKGYAKLGICKALWKIDRNTTLAVPGLIELLEDDFGPIRVDAATLLGEIGPEAAPAVPWLNAMVKHVPKAETIPETEGSSKNAPRIMTEAEFHPQIRSAAEIALRKISRSQ